MYQRQECFILANNFIGPEKIHADIFVSRVLGPMFHLIENARRMDAANTSSALKYLLVSFHDTNLSNLLRFILFFDTYGYDKFVMYSSSLRFELMKDILADESQGYDKYYMRIVFDNVELQTTVLLKLILLL